MPHIAGLMTQANRPARPLVTALSDRIPRRRTVAVTGTLLMLCLNVGNAVAGLLTAPVRPPGASSVINSTSEIALANQSCSCHNGA